MHKSFTVVALVVGMALGSVLTMALNPVGAASALVGAGPTAKGSHQNILQQALSTLVGNGTITQKQSDAIQGQVQQDQGAFWAKRPPLGRQDLAKVAFLLGLDVPTLHADLRSGQTIAAVASAKGISPTTLANQLVTALDTAIDAQVKVHHLSQARATTMKTNLPARRHRLPEPHVGAQAGGPPRRRGGPPRRHRDHHPHHRGPLDDHRAVDHRAVALVQLDHVHHHALTAWRGAGRSVLAVEERARPPAGPGGSRAGSARAARSGVVPSERASQSSSLGWLGSESPGLGVDQVPAVPGPLAEPVGLDQGRRRRRRRAAPAATSGSSASTVPVAAHAVAQLQQLGGELDVGQRAPARA